MLFSSKRNKFIPNIGIPSNVSHLYCTSCCPWVLFFQSGVQKPRSAIDIRPLSSSCARSIGARITHSYESTHWLCCRTHSTHVVLCNCYLNECFHYIFYLKHLITTKVKTKYLKTKKKLATLQTTLQQKWQHCTSFCSHFCLLIFSASIQRAGTVLQTVSTPREHTTDDFFPLCECRKKCILCCANVCDTHGGGCCLKRDTFYFGKRFSFERRDAKKSTPSLSMCVCAGLLLSRSMLTRIPHRIL